jgi:aspartyl-tRNA(Asn)/glutamyl-tRNA(Gln) amidotransferase subunit B
MLHYLGVFDPNVEGSMRCDANISMGSARVEVKNITGFKEVERALNYEAIRQGSEIKRKGKVERETRGWDDVAGVTRSMRSKEEEEDYGYIFDPDLPKITIEKDHIDELRATMPELPSEKIARYEKELSIPRELAASIVSEPDIAGMFEKVAEDVDIQLAAKWFAGEIKKTLNFNSLRLKDTGLEAKHIAGLLKMVESRQITDRSAELMLRELVLRPTDPEKLAGRRARIHDERALEPVIADVISANPKAIVDYKAGKHEVLNFLVGHVMRRTEGRGDSDTIRRMLERKLK